MTDASSRRPAAPPYIRALLAPGRIREGHGDLHAASICVVAGRPRFFDCLEFSARFRCADVAAEVAFLAMDLDHYGRADLARVFVDTYVNATRDQDLRALLPFYRCYRAFVRGKVRCLRLAEPHMTDAERTRATAEVRAHFDLAWSYAGGLPAPMPAWRSSPPCWRPSPSRPNWRASSRSIPPRAWSRRWRTPFARCGGPSIPSRPRPQRPPPSLTAGPE